MSELPEHVARNRRFWNEYAPEWVEAGHDELIEIRPPEGSTTRFPGSSLEWSRRWPLEEARRARRR